MRYLFNMKAYPIVESRRDQAQADIVALLQSPEVRAVAYRDSEMVATNQLIQSNIAAPQSDLAIKFREHDSGDERLKAGRKEYPDGLTTTILSDEAKIGGITINDVAIGTLNETANGYRELFISVYRTLMNDPVNPVVGVPLFTPKGGDGRAPIIHADFLSLTGHWAAALCPLDIMVEEPDDYMWDALNRRKVNLLDHETRLANDEWLTQMATAKQDDFLYSTIGDFLFMKGQRFRDLDKPADRAQVCVHKSSGLIPHTGQASFVFYPKVPKNE